MADTRFTPRPIEANDYQLIAKLLVAKYYNDIWGAENADGLTYKITTDEVYVVWFCKTLQNWKCLLSTSVPDGMYYEVTYNGSTVEIYLDAYKKFDNVCYKPPFI